VLVVKDLIAPIININEPSENHFFESNPPNYNISIIELNLDSFWYTLDNGVTNITITSLTGTIDPSEWDKHGNGTVNIRFYAKDEGDNEGFAELTVRKDVIIPLITINAPIINNIFRFQPPQYNVSIIENNIDKMWYTLDSGVITVPFVGNTGIINQTEWEKIENGTVTITFYANDSAGNIGQASVDVHKDILGPIFTINSPQDNEIFGFNAPNYDLSIEEFNLDSMWYTIDGGLTIIPIISLVGIIEQTEWEKKEGGTIPIRFYANDTLGNMGYSEVTIVKDILYGIGHIELFTPSAYIHISSNLLNFSWSSLDAGFGAVNFTLQISNTSNFGHIVFQSEDIAETPIVTNYSVPLSITTGQYYWRVQFTYKNYSGSWSDYFLFTFYINNYSPNLALEECTPTTGTRNTIFKITAIYYDLDNNAPFYIKILLNGISYFMEKVSPFDTDYINGCIYQYLTLLTPSTTAYTISFECSDGAFQYSTSTYQGPLVEPDSTPSTNQGDNNINSANTFAITMTLGITIGILIPFIYFTEKQVRKMKLGEKSSTKIKKKEIKS